MLISSSDSQRVPDVYHHHYRTCLFYQNTLFDIAFRTHLERIAFGPSVTMALDIQTDPCFPSWEHPQHGSAGFDTLPTVSY